MIHILAGDSCQAHVLARSLLHLHEPQYRVVTNERHLKGHRGGTLLRFGTWRDRPDRYLLCDLARVMEMTILDVTDRQ